ncbi:ABC transporter ATP-binding protein [Skermania sp. ID1734]|uniref:ABC transporter ATP-binding protein n=1 Tax=Skermania sp. ID1734 TaxID=2597516 RepID=UPI00117E87B0|nr:ABC transporter ATP-binding protein [Skermania sp. ID1734]TSE01878.1 ABC transporter ATP-binding protein [Skermania sp. ID1734]
MPPRSRPPRQRRPRLEARELSKLYGTFPAVDDVSFDVPVGSVTGLLGPHGAGKSTLIGMLLGLVRPSSGSALVDGAPLREAPNPGGAVGAVTSPAALHPKRTVRNHVDLYVTAQSLSDDRAQEALALVGLTAQADRLVGTLSVGEQQRAAIAGALVGHPQSLVIDEPAQGWAPDTSAWLAGFLPGFARRGGSVLIASRSLQPVGSMLDRMVILSRGRLVYSASTAALRAAHRDRLVVASSNAASLALALAAAGVTDAQIRPDGRLGIAGADTQSIVAIAGRAGVQIFDIAGERTDLEHAYLTLAAGAQAGRPS